MTSFFNGWSEQTWSTVLPVLYKTNANTYFLNWRQRTVVNSDEGALEFVKTYIAGVSAQTTEGYPKIVNEQVIRIQSMLWRNIYCF